MSTPFKPVDPTPRNGYVEVDHVRQDGILAIISKRIGNGPALFTTAIFKTYDRDGEEVQDRLLRPGQAGRHGQGRAGDRHREGRRVLRRGRAVRRRRSPRAEVGCTRQEQRGQG